MPPTALLLAQHGAKLVLAARRQQPIGHHLVRAVVKRAIARDGQHDPHVGPALAKGQAIHTILAEYFDIYRREGGFPNDLRDRAEYYLPRGPYPHDKAWRHDVDCEKAT